MEKDKMQEAIAQVSVELFQETQGTCSHLTRAQCRLRVQLHLCPDLSQAASLHPRRGVLVTERPPHPAAETVVVIAAGPHGADAHQITTD